jgi:excisionase family DNA binding protein
MERLAVDVREAARLTSLSVFTIRRRVRSGDLRAVRVGRRVLIPVHALEKLVREGVRDGAR